MSTVVTRQCCKGRQRVSDASFCNFEQKGTAPLFLLLSLRLSPPTEPSICLLSRHHIDSLSLPLSIIPTLLSVSLSGAVFLSTPLACFCQTVFHSVSFRRPPLFISTLALSIINKRFFFVCVFFSIYDHICLCASVLGLLDDEYANAGTRTHAHRSTSACTYMHMLAVTHIHTDGVQM